MKVRRSGCIEEGFPYLLVGMVVGMLVLICLPMLCMEKQEIQRLRQIREAQERRIEYQRTQALTPPIIDVRTMTLEQLEKTYGLKDGQVVIRSVVYVHDPEQKRLLRVDSLW